MKAQFITFILLILIGGAIFIYGITPKITKRTYQYTPTKEDLIVKHRKNGNYYFNYGGERVWVNRSFREKSLSGSYRGGGPHAGK